MSEEFEKDVSDLLISRLVIYVQSNFFVNSHLFGDKYHDVFDAFSLSLYDTENNYAQFFLWTFSSWQKIASGYEVKDEVKFLKTPQELEK